MVFEVGCGVGNFIFPLLEKNPKVTAYACDFSPRAVDFVKQNPKYAEGRCHAFVADITKDDLTSEVPAGSVDFASLIFVLSAIEPQHMGAVLHNIHKTLKPGGLLFFRDYGLYDFAQLRFKPGHKLQENLYVRQDGTMAYYFPLGKRVLPLAAWDSCPLSSSFVRGGQGAI